MTQNTFKENAQGTEQKKTSKSNAAAVVLAVIGFTLMLGAAGNTDCRDAMEYENQRVGYEKYNIDEEINPKATKVALWGGLLSLTFAAGLALKNKQR